jgi:formylglycine-generating enzyme required for sulfatase activity
MSIAEFYSSVGDRHQSHADMLLIPGGTFRMGSDRHYPEEAPVHRVAVEGFLIDRTPVTNRQFKDFVRATGHVTFAEIPPDPHNYPGALPHMLDGWKSRRAMGRVRELDPNFRLHKAKDRLPHRQPEVLARWEDALRRAGLPE